MHVYCQVCKFLLHSLGRVVVERRPHVALKVRKGADQGEVAAKLQEMALLLARVARRQHKAAASERPQHHACEGHGDCCKHCLQCTQFYRV